MSGSQKTLAESERYHRTLIHSLHEDLLVIDREYRITDINNMALKTLGKTRQDVIGRLCHEVSHGLNESCDKHGSPCPLHQVFFTGEPVKCRHEHVTSNGKIVHVDILASPIKDSEGNVTHVIEAIRDISDLFEAQEVLRKNEAFLNTLLDAIPTPVFYRDKGGRYLRCNRAFETFFGTTREQLIGETVFDTHPPEHAEIYHAKDAELLENGEIQQYESQVKNTHGELRDVIVNNAVFTDRQGAISGLVGTFLDITERKRTEEAYRISLSRFEELFNKAAIPLCIVNKELTKLDFNMQFEKAFGYSQKEIPTLKEWWQLAYPDPIYRKWVIDTCDAALQRAVKAKTDIEPIEYRVTCKNGDIRTMVAFGSFIEHDLLLTFFDITERKQVEETLRASEEQLQLALDASQMGQWNWNIVTGKVVWSQQCLSLYGLPPDTPMSYERFLQTLHPEDRERIHNALSRAVEECTSYDEVKRVVWPDGSIRWTVSRGQVYCDATGQPIRMIGVTFDITKWKETEEALRESEERFRTLVEQAGEGFFLHDSGKILDVNNAACDMLGYSREELLRLSIWDVDAKIEQDRHKEKFWEKLAPGKTFTIESELRRKDGTLIPVEIKLGQVEFRGRRLMLGLVRDVTERKQAEHERLVNLKFFESMDKINRAIQGANDLDSTMSDVLDVVLSIFNCDRAFLQYPCDPEALTWSSPMERSRPEYPGALDLGLEMPMDAEVAKAFQILLDSDGPVKFGPGTPNALPKDVSKRFSLKSFMSMAIHPKTDKPWQFGIHQCSHPRMWTSEEEKLFNEIGRRLSDALTSLLTYRDLTKSEKFLNNIVENIPNMIFVKDAEKLKFVRFNKAGEQLLGYSQEEMLGKTDYDFFPKEDADFFTAKDREVLSKKKLVDIPEEKIKNRNNDERILHTKKIPIMDETGKPQYLLGISEDITKNKKLENQLRQAQKMEAVGQLAGGIAHDFNNILGVIIGHTELAMDRLDTSHELFADLQEIRKAAERSTDLIRQLLAFARKQSISPKILDLNKTIEGMLKILRRLIGEDIDLEWRPGTGVWPVKMDPSQIDQILANLCINARDAIPGVGKVIIETHTMAFDETYCADHAGFIPGEYVLLIVSDNGCGMEREILSKIFEPFFTTKRMGQGTGLGLAMVYGIVKQNNGFINVYSEPGHGTTFKIYLPRQAIKTEQMKKESSATLCTHSHETILLVEDDPAVLKLTKTILEKLGYRTLVASTPGEAVRVAKEYDDEIHLLITDVVMPEMNGLDLAKSLISLYPDLKHLFMSGYTDNIITQQGVLGEGETFIQKPFSMQTLSAKVREVLNSK